MTQRMYPLRKVGNVTFRNLLCNCKVKNLFLYDKTHESFSTHLVGMPHVTLYPQWYMRNMHSLKDR